MNTVDDGRIHTDEVEDDFTHYFNATARLSKENRALREALKELFCCECGRKFDQADEWEHCATHQRIRDLLARGRNK